MRLVLPQLLCPRSCWISRAWLLVLLVGWTRAAEPVANPETHWSLQPLARPAVPAVGHPIDAFVDAALKTQGLTPNPPASPTELVRRMYFDLIGLPPSPQEVEEFLADEAPDREARWIDRLLASPRYGERWGRHWLDVVRYTESQGFEYDRLRDNAWPYRDYVIRSFNADLPYDRFMQEQIAGDVLEPVTNNGIIAASLLVAGPWDQAGNAQANTTQRAITREEEMEDLVSVVGQTFLGLTVNCARCHDHKFDPIPLSDYYRVRAVFDGVRHGDRAVEGTLEREDREMRRAAAQRRLQEASQIVADVEREAVRRVLASRPEAPAVAGPTPWLHWDFRSTDRVQWSGGLRGGARWGDQGLELSNPGDFFEAPAIDRDLREKSLEAWVALSDLEQGGGAAISLETQGGSPFDAIVFAERQPRNWMVGSEGFARTRDLAGPNEDTPAGAFVHLVAVFGSDQRIQLFRNGEPYGEAYASGAPFPVFAAGKARIVVGRRHEAGGRPWLTGTIRSVALHDRALSPTEVAAAFLTGGSTVTRAELARGLETLPRSRRKAREAAMVRVQAARADLQQAEQGATTVYAGTRSQPSPARILKRGDVKSPGDTVAPAALGVVKAVPAEFGLAPDSPEADRRKAFARWLADPANPLPARVMVNRVWHFHLGQGFVATPSDLGRSGGTPSHPELLDWLASDFIASGWSLKALHRRIMTSEAYRRSAVHQKAAGEVDADNRWLWRMSPRRLEAEAIRDAMLAVSGELNLQYGGPSFRPFTTSEYGAMFYHLFDKADPEFNRRTVYRMNINSGKEPLLDAFDCPDPSVKTPRRGVTTTPLQALGLMNGTFVQRQADRLASRVRREVDGDAKREVEQVYRMALGRNPTPVEREKAEQVVRDRGLESLCWALLNATEFVYVR